MSRKMKFQGKLLYWNDDKGFGFVEPNGGGERAFVHIKAFRSRSRRPVNGDTIIYELNRDKKNRFRAEKIKFVRDTKISNKRSKSKRGSNLGGAFTLLFCVGLLISVLNGRLPIVIAAFYIVMSSIAFAAYASDKSAAKNDRWRTQESTLHILSLMGGWPGAYFAQTILRHKSSKKEFKRIYWLTAILNLGGLIWLHTEKGKIILNNVISQLLSG